MSDAVVHRESGKRDIRAVIPVRSCRAVSGHRRGREVIPL
jgi:hypothetical protein